MWLVRWLVACKQGGRFWLTILVAAGLALWPTFEAVGSARMCGFERTFASPNPPKSVRQSAALKLELALSAHKRSIKCQPRMRG